MAKPPQPTQPNLPDHVTINGQHVRRQLELLMQMRSLDIVKVPVQGRLLWLNDIPEMCRCQCQADTLSVSDMRISQLCLTDLSFTRTAQTNEANPGCALMSQSSHVHWGVSWSLLPYFLDLFWLLVRNYRRAALLLPLLTDTIFCSLCIWLHNTLPSCLFTACVLVVSRCYSREHNNQHWHI